MEIAQTIPVPAPDFRLYLEREFLQRSSRNSRYSLRSFARDLDIEPSFLSKLIRGKQKITSQTLVRLSEKLDLRHDKIDDYLKKNAENLCFYNVIDEEQFVHVNNWKLFALIELFKIKDFRHDLQWIADRLMIDVETTKACLLKLVDMNFMELKNEKFILRTNGNTWNNLFKSTQARRDLQKSLLERSVIALENVPYEFRHHSSLTLACDEKLVPEIKQKINDFKDHLDRFIDKKGSKNSVYQLCLSFFPLTDKRYSDEIN